MTIGQGARFNHYEILSPIGAGGMGEVYLAEDTRLDRKVALKVLLPEFVASEDRLRRFVREAKAAAALNHPNIAHVYEVGEDGGTHYIAMEFVEGDTLTTRIRCDKNSLSTLLKRLSQVADGLAKAHAAGIVHRDLKPDNIMITPDGYAKILDFGLAKLIENRSPSGASESAATAIMPAQPLSAAGAVMGTVGYMSPEQAQGKPVDQRSDIFSFGCILFEAATGRRPFEGDSAIDTLHKIVYAPAPPVTDFNPDAPADLQRIIRRCLIKDPEKRYQTIKDVGNDLEDLCREIVDSQSGRTLPSRGASTADSPASQPSAASSVERTGGEIKRNMLGAALLLVLMLALAVITGYFAFFARGQAGPIESIAVMPFVNESGNQEAEYLSDGMTETLIRSLSQLPGLNVKARSSVFRYKGKETDAQTIGNELNVQAVLNGRVVQRGDRLTLSLELIDAETENVIWSEQYNRRQGDLLTLQTEIARDVSSRLKTKLSGADEQKLAKAFTTSPEAYRLYLQGRFYWNKREEKDFRKAIEYFDQAITVDPNYAQAFAGLADSYALLSSFGYTRPSEGMPKALEFARKALSFDDSLAEPHATLGLILISYDFDFAGAEREYRRAIELNPNYATAHQWYGEMLTSAGRFEEAAAEYRRGLEIEPLALPINWEYGRSLYYARKFDEAIAQLNKTLELDAGFAIARRTLSDVYRAKGDYGKAIEEQVLHYELSGNPQSAALTKEVFARGGWNAYLRLVTAENSPLSNRHFIVAKAYVELGDKEKAFDRLKMSYENRESPTLWLKVEPQLDPLRSDPRFQELLERIGFHR